MQTFLPYPDFEKCAQVLDYRRLGKMRVESRQIMTTLIDIRNNTHQVFSNGKWKTKGWVNHPAVRMWQGFEGALARYCNAMIREWVMRGYKNNMYLYSENEYGFTNPPWLGNHAFHVAHQSNLIRKDPEYYKKHFPDVPDNLEYIWPVNS